MQIVKLSLPVPAIGPAVDVHVRTTHHPRSMFDHRPVPSIAFCAAYDRQTGAWHFPATPEAIAALLAAAGVVLR